MTNKSFDDVIEKMELDEENNTEVKRKIDDNVTEHTSSEKHTEDILFDYKEVRNSIKQSIEIIHVVLERVKESIDNCTDEKYLARRVEALSQLQKTQIELYKELFSLHKNKKDLLKDDLKNIHETNKLNTTDVLDALIANKIIQPNNIIQPKKQNKLW